MLTKFARRNKACVFFIFNFLKLGLSPKNPIQNTETQIIATATDFHPNRPWMKSEDTQNNDLLCWSFLQALSTPHVVSWINLVKIIIMHCANVGPSLAQVAGDHTWFSIWIPINNISSSSTDVSAGGNLFLHQQEVTEGQLVTKSLVPGTVDSDVALECQLCYPPSLPAEKLSSSGSSCVLRPKTFPFSFFAQISRKNCTKSRVLHFRSCADTMRWHVINCPLIMRNQLQSRGRRRRWSSLGKILVPPFRLFFCSYKTRKSLFRLPPWARSKTPGSISTTTTRVAALPAVLQNTPLTRDTQMLLYVPTGKHCTGCLNPPKGPIPPKLEP